MHLLTTAPVHRPSGKQGLTFMLWEDDYLTHTALWKILSSGLTFALASERCCLFLSIWFSESNGQILPQD